MRRIANTRSLATSFAASFATALATALATASATVFAGWMPLALLSLAAAESAHAAGSGARASSERAVGGASPEAYWERQRQLHGWLLSELPEGVLDAALRVPLTQQDQHAIASDTTPPPRPLRVGMVKRVDQSVRLWPHGATSRAAVRLAHGVLRSTRDGGFSWAVALDADGASALRVHVSAVALPSSADVYFFSLDGQAHGPYRGRSDFWSHSVVGSQGILLVRHFGPVAAGAAPMSITLEAVGSVGEAFEGVSQALCPYNATCVQNAEPQRGQPVSDLKAATAYIQWVQGAWLYSCSGGLVADRDPSSQIPYFLTANHCLKSTRTAASLELFWNYTTSNGSCDGPVSPMTLGASVVATNGKGDFSLLELDEAPPEGSVFMGWNSEEIATTSGVTLHRVHHPGGAPQSYSVHVTDASFATCGGWPIPQRIYSMDLFGATEGGSSGSLVANDAGEVVGQLSGGCGTAIEDDCNAVDNRTVDGAFAFYFDQVAPFLDASCEPAPEICTDARDNDCDAAADCADSDCASDPSCEVACGPKNAACSLAADCCSLACGANGRCR